jgi:two-component system, NarL family, sensor kinase
MGVVDELRQPGGSARALAQFVISGFVAVALLGIVAVEIMRRQGTNEAIRDAKEVTQLAGNGLVAPNITPELLRGDPTAIKDMDEIVHRSIVKGSVVRVKLWDKTGKIVYSDEHRLIGKRYPLGDEEKDALEHKTVDAELSDLTQPENKYERNEKKLLEVYLGTRAPDASATPVLFEVYQRFSSVSNSGRPLWTVFAPALIGALLLLQVAQVPLAYSLLGRLRRGQREREALLQRALDAAQNERSRIAADLHDGAVQDLAGVSFTLAAAADRLERDGEAETAGLVDQAARDTRRSVRELRTLLVDLYPPSLHRQGLAAALSDLLAPLASRGMKVDLQADPVMRLPETAERVLFRAAQEGLRNVVKHAGAESVQVRVDRDNGRVALVINDDGRGLGPNGAEGADGHIGLQVVRDLARDSGGAFELNNRPEGGAAFRFEVPAS